MNQQILKIGAVSLLILLTGCTNSEASEQTVKQAPELDIMTVTAQTVLKEYSYPGLINAGKKVDLSSKVGGQVEEIFVSPGQEVKKGDKLALLGDSDGNVELQVSYDSAKNLLRSMNDTLAATKSANLQAIDSAKSKITIGNANLQKARDYKNDLMEIYVARTKQTEINVEKARLMNEMAVTEYDNYLLQSTALKNGSINQVIETNSYRDTLNTALRNAEDLADEMEDQAEDAVDRAEEFVDRAKSYLQSLQNTEAPESELSKAQMDVDSAEMNLETAEAALDRIELENDANIDALRKKLDTARTQIDGSMINDESNKVMISSKLDALGYNKFLAEQSYLEAKNALSLLENQKRQELNLADNDIQLSEKTVEDYKLNLAFTKGNINRGENELLTKIAELEGQVALLESRLKQQEIKAPFSGTISKKYIEIGKFVNVGAPLFEISNMDNVTVEWYLPESNLGLVQQDKKVMVVLNNKEYQAKITEIEPVAGKYSKKVRIEADLLSMPTVVDNTYAEVVLQDQSDAKKIQVPLSAVILKYKDAFVYTYKNNTINLVPITLGDSVDGEVVVEAGLMEGYKIILNPTKDLVDGMTLAN